MTSRARPVWRWLALAWSAGIVAVLLDPSPSVSSPFEHADKVVHTGLFFGLGFLWTVAERGAKAWIFGLAMALAALTEIVQATWMAGRSGDLADAVFDLVGATLGTVAAVGVLRWREKNAP